MFVVIEPQKAFIAGDNKVVDSHEDDVYYINVHHISDIVVTNKMFAITMISGNGYYCEQLPVQILEQISPELYEQKRKNIRKYLSKEEYIQSEDNHETDRNKDFECASPQR